MRNSHHKYKKFSDCMGSTTLVEDRVSFTRYIQRPYFLKQYVEKERKKAQITRPVTNKLYINTECIYEKVDLKRKETRKLRRETRKLIREKDENTFVKSESVKSG